MPAPDKSKSLESWICDAARSIHGAGDAPKFGKSHEYLIRKFAEGGGRSGGEFYTPHVVAIIMSRVFAPEPGMEIYDPTCGSVGLLIKCEIAKEEKQGARAAVSARFNASNQRPDKADRAPYVPLQLYGQDYIADTWAMACMNMFIHDMEGTIAIGDTFKNPKFRNKRAASPAPSTASSPILRSTRRTDSNNRRHCNSAPQSFQSPHE